MASIIELSEQKDNKNELNKKSKPNSKDKKSILYVLSILTRKVEIPYNYIGSNLKELIQKTLSRQMEGKCAVEGHIRNNSVRIVSYSSGILRSSNVVFDVVIECLVCTPVEGMRLKVRVKNITKAGLRCDTGNDDSPIDVFIARDHHYKIKEFSNIKEGDFVYVKVLGQRYELNDPKISVITELVSKPKQTKQTNLKLIIND